MERKKKPKKVESNPEHEEQQAIASEEVNQDAPEISESQDAEVKPEVMLDEQQEVATSENDPVTLPQDALSDADEFPSLENNGEENIETNDLEETQETTPVREDSFGEEPIHELSQPGDEIPESEELVAGESHEIKSDAEETPVESETASPENLPSAETPVDNAPADEKNNSAYISSQIDKLIRLKDENNFVDFWFYVKEMNKMIFTLRGVPREERLKFKDRIGELCEDAKKIQDELKAKVAKTSHLKLERIQQMADEALSFGTSHEEMEKSFHKMEEANKFLREGKVQGEDGEESADMSREHREKAKEIIKSARDKIFDRKREIREGNFKKVTQRLTSISDSLMSQGRPQKVFDGIKSLRNEMRLMNLDRSQLREIDTVIETIWKKAREKANTGREYESKKRITDMQDLGRRKEKFIDTLENEIKELNAKWSSNVKNEFFKNRVNEWIEEKKQKIEETKKEMQSIDEKVKFLTEQMNRT